MEARRTVGIGDHIVRVVEQCFMERTGCVPSESTKPNPPSPRALCKPPVPHQRWDALRLLSRSHGNTTRHRVLRSRMSHDGRHFAGFQTDRAHGIAVAIGHKQVALIMRQSQGVGERKPSRAVPVHPTHSPITIIIPDHRHHYQEREAWMDGCGLPHWSNGDGGGARRNTRTQQGRQHSRTRHNRPPCAPPAIGERAYRHVECDGCRVPLREATPISATVRVPASVMLPNNNHSSSSSNSGPTGNILTNKVRPSFDTHSPEGVLKRASAFSPSVTGARQLARGREFLPGTRHRSGTPEHPHAFAPWYPAC